jgi:hypothetical protein
MRRLVTIDLSHADVGRFEAYESKVLPLLDRHAGRLEWRLRAVDGSSETHLLSFADMDAYQSYRADPAREAAQDEWRSCGAVSFGLDVETVFAAEPAAGRTMDPAWAEGFAREWIEAWNAADLERILGHYVEDFEMASPLIRERMGVASGRLKGKRAIRPYWTVGLQASPPLRFELLDVLCGIDVVAINYRSLTRNRRVIEHLRFNDEGLIVSAEAIYRAEG